MNQGLSKWSPGTYQNDAKMDQWLQKWSLGAKVSIWDGVLNDLGIHFVLHFRLIFMKMLQKNKHEIDAGKVTRFYHKIGGKPCRNGINI